MNVVKNTPGSITVSNLLINTLMLLVILKLLTSYTTHLEVHGILSKIVDVFLIGVVFFTIYKRKDNLTKINVNLLFIVTFFMMYVLFINSFYSVGVAAFSQYSRLYFPMLFYIALSSYIYQLNGKLIHKKMLILIVFSIFLTIIGFYYMPENDNHGEIKLPTYFSGLHKSSYVFCFLLIAAFICSKYVSPIYKLCLLFSALFITYMIVEGWGIRTPFLAVIFFFYCYVIGRLRGSTKIAINHLVIIFFIFFIFIFGADFDWNKISSGRLLMWETKVHMFMSSSPTEAMFGKGYGSDYIEVGNWWGEKDSHNNYLQTLTELGVVGLILLFLTISFLYKSQNSRIGLILVIAYAITGAVSNGVIYRVLPSYIFVLILIYFQVIAVNHHRYIK